MKGKDGDTLLPEVNNNHHKHIEKKAKNQVDIQLIEEFFYYMTTTIDIPERYQNGLPKVGKTYRIALWSSLAPEKHDGAGRFSLLSSIYC